MRPKFLFVLWNEPRLPLLLHLPVHCQQCRTLGPVSDSLSQVFEPCKLQCKRTVFQTPPVQVFADRALTGRQPVKKSQVGFEKIAGWRIKALAQVVEKRRGVLVQLQRYHQRRFVLHEWVTTAARQKLTGTGATQKSPALPGLFFITLLVLFLIAFHFCSTVFCFNLDHITVCHFGFRFYFGVGGIRGRYAGCRFGCAVGDRCCSRRAVGCIVVGSTGHGTNFRCRCVCHWFHCFRNGCVGRQTARNHRFVFCRIRRRGLGRCNTHNAKKEERKQ